MPKTAPTFDDTGRLVVPTGRVEWDEWVAATRTRNHVLADPLVDWLGRYGEMKGYERDTPDPRTDFLRFVFRKGREFETRVADHLRHLHPDGVRTIISPDDSASQDVSLAAAEATWEAMAEGTPIVYQGVLRDARHRVYGSPDLLVRSDVLVSLFPGCLAPGQVAVPATDLDIGDRHYVIVDIKYSTLRFNAGGNALQNSGSARAYKAQVFLYNRALGYLQGHHPAQAFLLGRGWSRTQKGVTKRSTNCLDRLGPVRMDENWDKTCLEVHADQAVEWIRRMRRHGHDWEADPVFKIDQDYKANLDELPTPADKAVALESMMTAELSEDDPSFIYRLLGERLQKIKERQDADAQATAERLRELEEIADEAAAARQEPERLNLTRPGEYGMFTILRAHTFVNEEAYIAECSRGMVSHLRAQQLLVTGWSNSVSGLMGVEQSLLAESWNQRYQRLGFDPDLRDPPFLKPAVAELAKADGQSES